jgi:GTP-binding protein
MQETKNIRNIAIIAHVDHGKTTIVDALLKQTKVFRDNQAEMTQSLILDSNDQERERGITIKAKQTAINYGDYRINIVDTPGHADFSGEVERTINMADGCLLIVDAKEGPMPQTKFVLKKALDNNLIPIVIINKIDKSDADIARVEDETANLFLELAKNEEQLHYKTIYAIGKDGKSWHDAPVSNADDANMNPILDTIVDTVPHPDGDSTKPYHMLVTALEWDNFLGKYAIGRITDGQIKGGQTVKIMRQDGSVIPGKVDKIFKSQGLEKAQIEQAVAGDIVAITGLADAKIGDTIAAEEFSGQTERIDIEEPTIKISLQPNTSPFKGTEAKFSTSRQIADRLKKELETNIGLKVEENGIGFLISGRGELHLSVLIETMRREGFEFEVGRPTVVTKIIDGQEQEPYEQVTVIVDDAFVGTVQSIFGLRRAEQVYQEILGNGQTQIEYKIATRALIGISNEILTGTKGTAQVYSLFDSFQPITVKLNKSRNGALVAWESGTATAYSLQSAEDRGVIFIKPGEKVYAGQVVGLNNRNDDLEINIVKEKHLTNMRSKSSDGTVQLTPPLEMSLEQSLDFIEEDELLEVTPESLRIRKKELDHNKRKRAAKKDK